MQQQKRRNRALAIVFAFAAAAGLVVAAFGPRWLTEPDHEKGGFGLTTYRECMVQCTTGSISELLDALDEEIAKIELMNAKLPAQEQMAIPKNPWRGFAIVGMITFIASLVAAGGLVAGAVLALAGKRPELPIMPTTLAVLGLAFAIITGCIFVATKPASVSTMEVGWTFLTFGGAVVTGLASVFPLNRAIRPIDHELGEASATMSWGESRDDE